MRVVAFVIPLIAAQLSNWQLQQKYRELKSSLDPLKVKANRRFNAYDYTLEQIGKRLFALEENLAEALHRNENQDATIKNGKVKDDDKPMDKGEIKCLKKF